MFWHCGGQHDADRYYQSLHRVVRSAEIFLVHLPSVGLHAIVPLWQAEGLLVQTPGDGNSIFNPSNCDWKVGTA